MQTASCLLNKWNIYENQIIAGKRIIKNFEHGINYCILIAQMQSGKTGTAKYVAHNMINTNVLGKINKDIIYFACGMNDNDLRNQAIKEFKGIIPKKNILFSKQLQKINRQTKTKGEKETETANKIKLDLLIIDESHYGSNKSSQLDKLLKLVDAKFILSVSATPMAEVASKYKHGKAMVELNPGEGYYGLADIFRNGLISQSKSLSTDEGCEYLYSVIEDEIDKEDPKYCIVRIPSQYYQSEIEEEIIELYPEVKFINHHSEHSNVVDFNKYTNKKPKHTTIIWIYNALRAGKQLNTQNIGFVYDTSKSRADVIAQSLLGRIFGYDKEDHQVQCYTDMVAAKMMLNWVQSLYCKESIPNCSKNIQNGYIDKVKKWSSHPPIIIDIPKEISDIYYRLKIDNHNRYPYKEDVLVDILRYSEPEDENKVEEILDDYVPGKCGGLMILNEENKPKSYKCHWDFNYKAAIAQKPVRGFDTTNESMDDTCFYYIYYNLNTNSDSYSKALLIYKERIFASRDADYVQPNLSSMYV
jgi:hypothetical protein